MFRFNFLTLSPDEVHPSSGLTSGFVFEQSSLIGESGPVEIYRVRINGNVFLHLKLKSCFLASEAERQQLKRQYDLLHSLTIEDVPRVHQAIFTPSEAGFIMDSPGGKSLNDLLALNVVPEPAVALEMTLRFTATLAALHERGIVHRAINPETLFISPDWILCPVDFYLAANPDVVPATGGQSPFVAPELRNSSGGFSPASDLYSLGMIMVYIFGGNERDFSKIKIASYKLFEVIERCTRENASERYSSAEEVLDDLKKVSFEKETRSLVARPERLDFGKCLPDQAQTLEIKILDTNLMPVDATVLEQPDWLSLTATPHGLACAFSSPVAGNFEGNIVVGNQGVRVVIPVSACVEAAVIPIRGSNKYIWITLAVGLAVLIITGVVLLMKDKTEQQADDEHEAFVERMPVVYWGTYYERTRQLTINKVEKTAPGKFVLTYTLEGLEGHKNQRATLVPAGGGRYEVVFGTLGKGTLSETSREFILVAQDSTWMFHSKTK